MERKMPDTIYRQWLMLNAIPHAPRKIDTATIERRLADKGFKVTRRSIQRDLIALSTVFPLACDDRSKPYGWSWLKNADIMDIPGMDPHTAVTFRLVGDFMSPLLPRSTMDFLKPHLDRAKKVLSAIPDMELSAWPGKVRIIPSGHPLIPCEIDPSVLRVVYDALLSRRKFKTTYRVRGAKENKNYDVNPLGLVIRAGVIYLVCTLWTYDNPVQLVLHRMLSAEITDEPASSLSGFNLDEYIKTGGFGFRLDEKPLKVVLKFTKQSAIHLLETPLSKNQKAEEKGDYLIVRATVPDTLFLRRWLLGFGDEVEVLGPKALRTDFASITDRAARIYQ